MILQRIGDGTTTMQINKLFYKLLVSLILISIIPLLLTGWYIYNQSNHNLSNELDKRVELLTEQKINTIKLFIDDLQRIHHIIEKDSTIANFLGSSSKADDYYRYFLQLDPILNSLTTIRPEAIGVTIINQNDEIYWHGYSLNLLEKHFNDFDWMAELSSSNTFISEPHLRPYALRDDNEMVFSFVKPIWNPASNTEGTLIIDFPFSVLDTLFGEDSSGSDSGTFLLNQHGEFFYPHEATLVSKAISGQNLDHLEEIRLSGGELYRLFVKKYEETGWTIVSYFPYEDLYSVISSYKTVIIFILIFTTIICLITALLISHHIAHPIQDLVKLMEVIQTGNLDQRFYTRRKDEIGKLAKGFNQMIDQIQYLIDKIKIEQKEKQLREITALQAQINPHFLYNTLESINSLARNNKQHDISKQIALLGKLLRFSISSFQQFVPIKKEVEYITQYLQINKLRLKHMPFDFNINVEERILDLYTIKWILQPIVENAIIHGMAGRENGVRIDIVGKEQGDNIVFVIKDNGNGMKGNILKEVNYNLEHDAVKLTRNGEKVGLYNVQARIRLHYGSNYGINIFSLYGQGTSVEIVLPRRNETHV